MTDTTFLDEWDEAPADTYTLAVSRNDRIASILVVLMVALALMFGLGIRQRELGRTVSHVDREAGIEMRYPAGWLLDSADPAYTLRVSDPNARPFKTLYQITIVPASGQTTVRNVLDTLTLQRSSELSAYRVLNVGQQTLGGQDLIRMNFVFVETDPNPFIQRLPVVVLGTDVVLIDAERAIVVTYMAEQDTFEQGLPGFERFLTSLRY
jgi:hypothetical protein